MGLLPRAGVLTLDGERIDRPTVEAMVARGVALVPEKRELFGEMSVEDNLLLGGFRAGARASATRAAHGRGVRHLPAPQGAPRPAGGHAVGRRAPDAGHRPRADGARAC
jgi:branched-chain amino acid transport system ATP-binding protein